MGFEYGIDRIQPAFEDRSIPYITYGLPYDEACAFHLETTLELSRVYIIASGSLSKNTDALKRLQSQLGDKVVGVRVGMDPHTRWNQIIEVVRDALPLKPDCLITLGAGSLTDASKVIAWMLANEITTVEEMDRMWESGRPDQRKDLKPPTIRTIAIPTSLSGGEYQSSAGATRDDGSNQKCHFRPPIRNPSLVVLDPALTTTTPERIWLSTGVRAIDHCIETLCSLLSNDKGDQDAEKALLKLVPSLLRTRKDPRDLDARFESMMGVIEAMGAVGSGVPMGASHAIGHQLGPLGVGHGETSCIMLPAVCKWNAAQKANVERQVYTRDVLLRIAAVRELLVSKFGEGKEAGDGLDLGDILDAIFRELGMPRTLKEVGVGREKMDGLAQNSLADRWIGTNAKPITEKAQVMEILETVVE